MEFITHFFRLFLYILFGAYLVPATALYVYLYILRGRRFRDRKIQPNRSPSAAALRREVAWSIISVLIFTVLTQLLLFLIQQGYTKVYPHWLDRGLGYWLFSLPVVLVLHDTYFYWVHRLMHWRPVYRYVHRLHHLSISPNPFTMFAFQPLEAVIHFSVLFVAVFLLPLHSSVIFFWLAYNVVNNAAGHSGIEVTSRAAQEHWLLRYNNTVTHHDMHHAHFHCNYSQYFNIWDRIMGTYYHPRRDG